MIDFEVIKYDWLVVCIDPTIGEYTNIVNDPDKLKSFYEDHKSDIWIGYNSRSYDQYILKGILLGFDPKEINDYIIKEGHKGWQFSSEFNRLQLFNYDCYTDKRFGLKQLESFMGNNIKESSISFDIDRKLTDDEIQEMLQYCTHDVEQTMQVFIKRIDEWNTQLQVLKAFDLPINHVGKTQTQLAAVALGCTKKDWFDEWEFSIVDTLQLGKYDYIRKWFEDPDNHDYEKKLIAEVGGIPHVYGWGGLHGAIGEIKYKRDGAPVVKSKPFHAKGLILHVDVTSFYPSIMIHYDMLSRNVSDKNVYKQIYDTRVALKKAGKKAEQAPYKLILNKTYGGSKDKHSKLYDPRRANEVCINGMLLLTDLIAHLENHCKLIQSNTDGLIIQIPDNQESFDLVDDICYEWEKRTGMGLGLDVISEIYQKDVNNYLWIDDDGNVERIGKYLKPLHDLDCDLKIVNDAMVAYLVNKTPVETTINNCDVYKDFQKVVKVSSKYEYGQHNGQKLQDKTFRVFASNDDSDTAIYKVKDKNGDLRPEKFADTPLHCFIENGAINGKQPPAKLDRTYYINLAKKRLSDFGIDDVRN